MLKALFDHGSKPVTAFAGGLMVFSDSTNLCRITCRVALSVLVWHCLDTWLFSGDRPR
jgi:hypothetical protein